MAMGYEHIQMYTRIFELNKFLLHNKMTFVRDELTKLFCVCLRP